MIEKYSFKISTKGNNDILNIIGEIEDILEKSKIKKGIVNLFVVGSTAGLTTIEFEPGLVKDLQEAFEKIAPKDKYYHHHEKWHDDNGNSHVRASLLKPDLTAPFDNRKLQIGTWQQIVLIDFDTTPRKREIIVSLIGE